MNSRERVLTSLRHREPDRIPFDLGSTNVTGITRNAYLALRRYLGEEKGALTYYDVIQQLASMQETMLRTLEVDTRGLIPNIVRHRPHIEEHGEYRSFTDEWGVEWRMPKDGLYFDLAVSPLAGNITISDIDHYPWPDPMAGHLFDGLRPQAMRWHREGYAVILESVCAGIVEMSCRVRGYEQFYMDLMMDPELACRLLDQFLEIKLAFYGAAATELGGYVQFIREGDDLAGQETMLVSPSVYRKYIKPRHAEMFRAQRRLFPQPFHVFFHSDGAIVPILRDFIELGVDVLNPVQISADRMDTARLKAEYGNDLAFWGGAADPQILARSEPGDIRGAVRRSIENLAPGGGYVFGAIHNIQNDVPPEHFMALWETFREMRDYPLNKA